MLPTKHHEQEAGRVTDMHLYHSLHCEYKRETSQNQILSVLVMSTWQSIWQGNCYQLCCIWSMESNFVILQLQGLLHFQLCCKALLWRRTLPKGAGIITLGHLLLSPKIPSSFRRNSIDQPKVCVGRGHRRCFWGLGWKLEKQTGSWQEGVSVDCIVKLLVREPSTSLCQIRTSITALARWQPVITANVQSPSWKTVKAQPLLSTCSWQSMIALLGIWWYEWAEVWGHNKLSRLPD